MDTDKQEIKPDPRKALFQALTRAQSIAERVEKTGKNLLYGVDPKKKGNYAKMEELIRVGREALNQCGLSLLMLEHSPYMFNDRLYMSVKYLLIHDLGDEQTHACHFPVIEDRGKPLDKAYATAMTFCLGYAYRDILGLERVDADIEADAHDDSAYDPVPRLAQEFETLIGQVDEATRSIAKRGLAKKKDPVEGYTASIAWLKEMIRKGIKLSDASQTQGV